MSDKNTIFNPGNVIDYVEQNKKKKAENNDIQILAKRFIDDHSERNFNALMKRCSWGLKSYIF